MRNRPRLLIHVRALLGAGLLAPLLAAATPDASVASPGITGVYPSADSVPANLLRLSLTFASPPAGPVLPHLHILEDNGQRDPGPFLEQELWSPDEKTLTILFHPGRVKTGLIAHDEAGRTLVAGHPVALTYDTTVIKRWNVTPELEKNVDVSEWHIVPPQSRTSPIVVQLARPIDWESRYLIAVESPDHTKLAGQVELSHGETVWALRPDVPLAPGTYRIRIHPELEDPEGNRTAAPFEEADGIVPSQEKSLTFSVR